MSSGLSLVYLVVGNGCLENVLLIQIYFIVCVGN
jgi:hypothetical protein